MERRDSLALFFVTCALLVVIIVVTGLILWGLVYLQQVRW